MIAVIAIMAVGGALAWLSAPYSWRRVQGTVLESHCFTGGSVRGPVIVYRYTIDGVSYTGDRLSRWSVPGRRDTDHSLCPWDAAAFIGRHPAGSSIELRVHPARPDLAVATWTLNRPGTWIAMAIVGILIGVSMQEARTARRLRTMLAACEPELYGPPAVDDGADSSAGRRRLLDSAA